jgi:hypothetical protein
LALLIFDRNLILMPFPFITCILSISISQTCGSLWPGRRSLRQKNLKKIAKRSTSSIEHCGNGQIAYFLHLLIQSFWVPCDLSSKNFSKKIYYLKLRFMCQDMPRMQDFAPFTTELLGAISGPLSPGHKDYLASEVGKSASRAWLDNLNFDLGCPNDY